MDGYGTVIFGGGTGPVVTVPGPLRDDLSRLRPISWGCDVPGCDEAMQALTLVGLHNMVGLIRDHERQHQHDDVTITHVQYGPEED